MLIAHGHTLHRLFNLMTHLGDPAFLLPLSVAVAGILLRQNQRSAGLWFGLVIAADVMLTLASKLWFYAGGGSADLNILTPSGHVSLGVTFYGCVAMILASQRRFARQAVIAGAAVLAILAICLSRIALRMHTPEEVFFGSLVGALCVAVFAAAARPLQRLRLRLPIPLVFVVAAASVSVWAIGHRFDTEDLIGQWGVQIGSALGLS